MALGDPQRLGPRVPTVEDSPAPALMHGVSSTQITAGLRGEKELQGGQRKGSILVKYI